eukprot:gene29191-38258_t
MSASKTEVKKKTKSTFLFVARIFLFGVVAFASYGAKYLFREPWMHAMDITEEDFSKRSNFTVKTFPTTFYEKGKLGDVLNGWDPNSGAHLYRLVPGSDFSFDFNIVNSDARAKERLPECVHESTLCEPCFGYNHTTVNAADILNDNQGGREFYAAFAKLEDFTAVSKLWDILQLPGIPVEKMVIEHAFVSNFKTPFVGKKTWIFYPPSVYRGANFLSSFQTDGHVFPRRAPSEPYELFAMFMNIRHRTNLKRSVPYTDATLAAMAVEDPTL